MAVSHRINRSAVTRLLSSPGGPVARNMLRRGIRVQTRARELLTSRKPGVDTGRLRASITVDQELRGMTVVTRVGTNVEYAIFVHNGTRYMNANPFLTDALPAAIE